MDFIPKDKFYELRPDTLQYVRKLFDLDKPGTMKESVKILNEWVQKQQHFNKKDFTDHYLEMTIILSKGSIERAKRQLDQLCTMRTLWPEFFGAFKLRNEFDRFFAVCQTMMLPKLTEDHCRTFVTKFYKTDEDLQMYFYRHNVVLGEYLKAHDYFSGLIVVIDFVEADLLTYLKTANLVQFKQAMAICFDGYKPSVKGIHIISQSKFIDGLVTLVKQVVSAKVAARIKIHKNHESLHDFIPKAILPKDYGGEERSLKILQDELIDLLSSKEHLDYLEGMNAATTKESCRRKDEFSEHYAGMPGSFRYLSVD
ncbi:alpha-tocopherol transfer protein-like [Bicyclus anynana]|uniref:Alpha-tocopherol transfer protein-like n=1 Tax=Bicyclus anynana TaxID=110368 RepID=A0A6J1P581_BICAN|nr:alpha-tocopherol transfer protein-like [Bicyclus anynana]